MRLIYYFGELKHIMTKPEYYYNVHENCCYKITQDTIYFRMHYENQWRTLIMRQRPNGSFERIVEGIKQQLTKLNEIDLLLHNITE